MIFRPIGIADEVTNGQRTVIDHTVPFKMLLHGFVMQAVGHAPGDLISMLRMDLTDPNNPIELQVLVFNWPAVIGQTIINDPYGSWIFENGDTLRIQYDSVAVPPDPNNPGTIPLLTGLVASLIEDLKDPPK